MPTIEEVLRDKEVDLTRLQEEVQALRLAVRIMAQASGQKPTPSPTASGRLSQPMMARAILLGVGHEMHVKDIAAGIKERFDVTITPGYLAPVLYRQIGNIFFKSEKAPNTFGLTEWPSKRELVSGSTGVNEITRTPDGTVVARHTLVGGSEKVTPHQ